MESTRGSIADADDLTRTICRSPIGDWRSTDCAACWTPRASHRSASTLRGDARSAGAKEQTPCEARLQRWGCWPAVWPAASGDGRRCVRGGVSEAARPALRRAIDGRTSVTDAGEHLELCGQPAVQPCPLRDWFLMPNAESAGGPCDGDAVSVSRAPTRLESSRGTLASGVSSGAARRVARIERQVERQDTFGRITSQTDRRLEAEPRTLTRTSGASVSQVAAAGKRERQVASATSVVTFQRDNRTEHESRRPRTDRGPPQREPRRCPRQPFNAPAAEPRPSATLSTRADGCSCR